MKIAVIFVQFFAGLLYGILIDLLFDLGEIVMLAAISFGVWSAGVLMLKEKDINKLYSALIG